MTSSKWYGVRSTFKRAHEDLFEPNYTVEFFNYSGGDWSPDDDEFTGESRDSIGTANVEIVPPAIDSTVRTEGTSFSWDTSIRLPLDDAPVSDFVPLGEDSKRPTEVEITDNVEDKTEVYELHGFSEERGSGMVMCRIVEM